MYHKILKSNKYLEPNKRDFNWLFSIRSIVKFNEENISFKKNVIDYNNMENVNILKYNTLLFFTISNILSFKYKDSFYQIGINNTEKSFIINKIKKININNEKYNVKDLISFIVVVICLLWPIFYFF